MQPFKPFALLAIALTIAAISCKKKSNDTTSPIDPTVNYRAKTMDFRDISGKHTLSRMVYNANGFLDSMISTGPALSDTKKFNWYGDTACRVVITFDPPNSSQNIETYQTYNSDGALTTFTTPSDAQVFSYIGRELHQIHHDLGVMGADYETYTWANGDLYQVLASDTVVQVTYTYDTTKQVYRNFLPLPTDYLSGRLGYTSKHLLTRVITTSDDRHYFYDFDANGRVLKQYVVTAATKDTATYTYGY